MGYNSNNWATEASLRNERRIKAESMSALLDHVEWNPETLTISLSGITLSWDDIEGADTVLKKDTDGKGYITQITRDTIATTYIIADSVAADNITTATLWGRTFGFDFSITDGFSVGYVGDVEDYRAKLRVGEDEDGYGQVFIESQGISLNANKRIDLWANSGIYINGASPITGDTIGNYLSGYVTKPSSGHTSAPSFFRPIGFTNSSHTSVGYMTLSEMQGWLGIA